VCLSVKRLNIL